MAPISRVLAVAVAAASLYLSHAAVAESKQLGFEYLSPLPGSAYHLPETNIILRPGGNLDGGSVAGGTVPCEIPIRTSEPPNMATPTGSHGTTTAAR